MDKSHMFWSTNGKIVLEYSDGHSIPRADYRCEGYSSLVTNKQAKKHPCKLVVDHPGGCKCLCGLEFNEEENEK